MSPGDPRGAVPVLTVTGARWESELVAAAEHRELGVAVVRRCVDLADLLATATSGTARAVLLSADLRRLDRDALARLETARVAVVALVVPNDEAAERRLRQLGCRHVLPADSPPDRVSAAVRGAVAELAAALATSSDTRQPTSYADPRSALPYPTPSFDDAGLSANATATGKLVAVWGPAGAPGRTTVAVTMASEAARMGIATLLVDADTYGGCVAQLLGLLDEAPGIAAATRLANSGSLDRQALARVARSVQPHLRVLSGLTRPQRWAELRAPALDTVWSVARALSPLTVVDCGFSLERDEELAFDTAAPRRNGATLVTLEAADIIVAVGAADPVGMQRLVRDVADLREIVPNTDLRIVLNGVRRGPVGPDPEVQLAQALDRYAGFGVAAFVPYDRAGCDAMLAAGRSLAECAATSPIRPPLADLVAELLGRRSPAGRGLRCLWRRPRTSDERRESTGERALA
jgi:Mrp family chromosome partitioning ATPase